MVKENKQKAVETKKSVEIVTPGHSGLEQPPPGWLPPGWSPLEQPSPEQPSPERPSPERPSPELGRLETIVNPHPDRRFVVRFTCPEFTCLCPLSARPDFAHLVIDYLPKEVLLESKSLKLFLAAFRDYRGFHEDCTITIARRIEQAVNPHWMRIGGYWYPRGGIPIDVFYQSAAPPEGVWIPPQKVEPYRGR